MVNVLACQVIAPRPYREIEARLLHINPSCQDLCPVWEDHFRKIRLPVHYKINARPDLCILPRFREPAVHEILKLIRIILGFQKFLCNFRPPDERTVKSVHPESNLPCELRPCLDDLPPPRCKHLRLVPILYRFMALRTDINCELSPIRITHILLIRKLDILHLQLDFFPTMRAPNEIMLYNVAGFQILPDMPRF